MKVKRVKIEKELKSALKSWKYLYYSGTLGTEITGRYHDDYFLNYGDKEKSLRIEVC